MQQAGSVQYTWDAESRLTAYGNTWTYTYDANGNRVRKSNGSNFTEYLYFGGNIIAEKDQSGTWTDYIFAGGKRVAKAQGASTSSMVYFHSDHLGSSRLMTDASGNVVSTGTYLPYGYEYDSVGTTSNYRFTGKERDSESGLDYFGARFYSSTMGRFVSPDWSDTPAAIPYAELADPQSLNLFGYVRNNPVARGDSDGHDADWLDTLKHSARYVLAALTSDGAKRAEYAARARNLAGNAVKDLRKQLQRQTVDQMSVIGRSITGKLKQIREEAGQNLKIEAMSTEEAKVKAKTTNAKVTGASVVVGIVAAGALAADAKESVEKVGGWPALYAPTTTVSRPSRAGGPPFSAGGPPFPH